MTLRLTPAAALALLAGLSGCHGPSFSSFDEGDSGEHGTTTESGGSESETGEPPFSCEPWPDPPAQLGMGSTTELSFVDVTAEAGLLDTAYYTDAWPPGCNPAGVGWVDAPCKMELQGGGGAVGDFDADGWPDLYLTRLARRDLLFHNLGDGSFEELGEALGLVEVFDGNGAAWADLDGDGDLDLYVSSFGTPERFYWYRNVLAETGVASFVEEALPRGLALDDGAPHYGFSIAVGDYDRDGWLDLFTTEWRPGTSVGPDSHHVRLLHNLGLEDPAAFVDRTEAAGVSMLMQSPPGVHAFAPAFVDLDEDRWPDLAVVSDNGTSRLFWNEGGDTFSDGTAKAKVSLEDNGMGSTFGDFDGDGHLDWYVTAIFSPDPEIECGNAVCGSGGNRLYRNRAPRCFEDLGVDYDVQLGGWGWGAAMWDPDNDGDLDLIETNGFQVPHGPPATTFVDHPLRFWRNGSELLGHSAFAEMSALVGLVDSGQGRGLIVWDYDRDGDEDLLVIDNAGAYGTGTKLWRNEGGDQNAWIDVVLRGDPSGGNLGGLGARIELRRELAGPAQVRVIGVGGHFLGQGEHRAHFGLGPSEAPVAEIKVIWPTGGEETVVTGAAARQTLELSL